MFGYFAILTAQNYCVNIALNKRGDYMKRRVIDRVTLINKLNNFPYKEVGQTIVDFWFKSIGYEIDPEVKEEESDEDCNTN